MAFQPSKRDERPLEEETLEEVAEAVSDYWSNGTRHNLCRAVTGYLINAGLPTEQVAIVLKAVLAQAADEEARCRLYAAREVADRAEAGLPVPGAGWLSVNLPELLDTLDGVTNRNTRYLSVWELFGVSPSDTPETPEEGTTALEDLQAPQTPKSAGLTVPAPSVSPTGQPGDAVGTLNAQEAPRGTLDLSDEAQAVPVPENAPSGQPAPVVGHLKENSYV